MLGLSLSLFLSHTHTHRHSVLVNLRKLKSYQAFFQPQLNETRNQLQEEKWKIHKYLEIKQHATEPLGQRRNLKKLSPNSWDAA